MNENFIYLDHSATTPTDPRVVAAMLPHFTPGFRQPVEPARGRENGGARAE